MSLLRNKRIWISIVRFFFQGDNSPYFTFFSFCCFICFFFVDFSVHLDLIYFYIHSSLRLHLNHLSSVTLRGKCSSLWHRHNRCSEWWNVLFSGFQLTASLFFFRGLLCSFRSDLFLYSFVLTYLESWKRLSVPSTQTGQKPKSSSWRWRPFSAYITKTLSSSIEEARISAY